MKTPTKSDSFKFRCDECDRLFDPEPRMVVPCYIPEEGEQIPEGVMPEPNSTVILCIECQRGLCTCEDCRKRMGLDDNGDEATGG